MTNKPKIIVVGANGYLGSAIYKAASTNRITLGTSSAGLNGFLKFSLARPADFDYSQVCGGDVVCLSAAISSPDMCTNEFNEAWRINVESTSEFINNLHNHGAKVIFFSSDAVYGECNISFDEMQSCNPSGAYGSMKREVENRFTGNELFKSIRLSYVFSRHDKFTNYLVGCALKSEEAEIFHPFERAVVYRDDVVSGVLALIDLWTGYPEQFINFGGPICLSRVDLAEYLRATTLPNLQFKVTKPEDSFFRNRPRTIAMTSPLLAGLLGRQPLAISEVVSREFSKPDNWN